MKKIYCDNCKAEIREKEVINIKQSFNFKIHNTPAAICLFIGRDEEDELILNFPVEDFCQACVLKTIAASMRLSHYINPPGVSV